jgi:hypothetical protein
MPRCFVIQPFDGGPYDKRYADVLLLEIKGADLELYCVDKDLSSSIPIEDIEENIRIRKSVWPTLRRNRLRES